MSPIITLTTDFGLQDGYSGIMKGVILGINPDAQIVDLSHDIAAFDVMEAAFVLKSALPYFPAGTVHMVVVDPGVGTERRPIGLRSGGCCYVGPDNGVFDLVLSGEPPEEIVELNRMLPGAPREVSMTFHGRDIFSPAAAHLSRGMPLASLGDPVEALVPLRWALPIVDEEGVSGWVAHVDRFGNCITNISESDLRQYIGERAIRTYAGSAIIQGLQRTYGDVSEGEPLVLIGSSGYLEVAVRGGNAAELMGLSKSSSVSVLFAGERQPLV